MFRLVTHFVGLSVKWVPFSREKGIGCEADHLHPSSTNVYVVQVWPPYPLHVFMALFLGTGATLRTFMYLLWYRPLDEAKCWPSKLSCFIKGKFWRWSFLLCLRTYIHCAILSVPCMLTFISRRGADVERLFSGPVYESVFWQLWGWRERPANAYSLWVQESSFCHNFISTYYAVTSR